jgi:thiol-disulfide isomerase/thioredoxin
MYRRTVMQLSGRHAPFISARAGRATLAGMLAVAGVLASIVSVHAGGDWNDAQIAWQPYEKGLEVAKSDKKPVCLVFYTEWCPHCRSYSGVFHDGKVVEQAKRFVMIRLDKDKNADISKKYAPDGEYIPRTYFLSSAGTLDPEIHAARDQYKYFYDEHDAASVLGGMETALKKLK